MKNVLVVAFLSVVLAPLALAQTPPAASQFNVRNFGAVGDGAAKDTAAVQSAIDACAAAGGGTVYFAPGTYLCGSVQLKTGVYLYLDAAATVKGSPDNEDYNKIEKLDFKNDADAETSFFHYALIWAEDAQRIGILGPGTIDSNRTRRHGPKPTAWKRCQYLDVKGIHIINAPNYAISMLGTDYVNIDGVTILNDYCDGIDPDSCRNVRISNCHIESRDDCIVPKTSFALGEHRSCENITVTNCFLATPANCFKLGTESGGDFKYITVTNCVMTGFNEMSPATSGVSLESVDGANIDGVTISNLSMHHIDAPIFIRLGARLRDNAPAPGSLRNVLISNVVAVDARAPSSITGIPGAYPEGISLSNVRLTYSTGLPAMDPNTPVPELEKEYPDADMFETLPAYGLYCRHVKDLSLANVHLLYTPDFQRKGPGPKPSEPANAGTALVADDVTGLDVDALHALPSKTKETPIIKFINVREASVRNCRAPENTGVYLNVSGQDSARIDFSNNAMLNAQAGVATAAEVLPQIVHRVPEN
ncbi:MAG: glycosyl hydrolase family 28 protein [Candidatus Hydrogenedentes bacterium]|nr:glycosyl hydrolase family 28 protein [Candidatus Hydrogenedentota bacterium]